MMRPVSGGLVKYEEYVRVLGWWKSAPIKVHLLSPIVLLYYQNIHSCVMVVVTSILILILFSYVQDKLERIFLIMDLDDTDFLLLPNLTIALRSAMPPTATDVGGSTYSFI